MKTNTHFWSYLARFFLECEIFQTNVERIKTRFMFGNVYRKSGRLWDKMEKYRRVGQATDDNMAHAHCILDT
jgi:hypothetical protein